MRSSSLPNIKHPPLGMNAHSQDQLQYTSARRALTYLHFHAMSNCTAASPYTRRIGKLSRILHQAGGLGGATTNEQKHDAEQPAQVPDSCLWSCRKPAPLITSWRQLATVSRRGARLCSRRPDSSRNDLQPATISRRIAPESPKAVQGQAKTRSSDDSPSSAPYKHSTSLAPRGGLASVSAATLHHRHGRHRICS